MAKEVKWTLEALLDRKNIFLYWVQKNDSDAYSNKLENLFNKSANLISYFPHIGKPTQYRNVYYKVVKDYKIFYRITSNEVQILRIWDTRQNPDLLKF